MANQVSILESRKFNADCDDEITERYTPPWLQAEARSVGWNEVTMMSESARAPSGHIKLSNGEFALACVVVALAVEQVLSIVETLALIVCSS